MIALGQNIGVNTIIGIPFIKGTQCLYDPVSDTVVSRVLDTEPFKVINMQPQCYDSTPFMPKAKTDLAPNVAAVQRKLEEIFTAQMAPTCAGVAPRPYADSSPLKLPDCRIPWVTTDYTDLHVPTGRLATPKVCHNYIPGSTAQPVSPPAIQHVHRGTPAADTPSQAPIRRSFDLDFAAEFHNMASIDNDEDE
jgi:hypothetical protein